MKKILSGIILCFVTARTAGAAQITTDGMLYANKISAYSSIAAQNSISNAVFGAYDYYGLHVGRTPTHKQPTDSDRTKLYGTMPMYGEWNDDGTATSGRNGGDTFAPQNLNVWGRWTHNRANEEFNHFKKIRQNNDIILAGVGTNKHDIANGWASIGAFTGYTGGTANNTYIDIDQQGGYLGIYGSYTENRMRVNALATIGKANSDIPNKFGGDTLNNTWANLSALTTFDFLPAPSFTLQPGLRLAYTWIKSQDFDSIERIHVSNDDFNYFLISPQLRAIKHMGYGWFASAHVKYMWQIIRGGGAYVSDQKLSNLKMGNYTEYGIGLEKLIGQINTSIDISRQDGARTGWAGGAHVKYAF